MRKHYTFEVNTEYTDRKEDGSWHCMYAAVARDEDNEIAAQTSCTISTEAGATAEQLFVELGNGLRLMRRELCEKLGVEVEDMIPDKPWYCF